MAQKLNTWQITTILLGALLIASIFTNGFSGAGVSVKGKVTAAEAAKNAVDFLNNNLLQAGQTATLKSVGDRGDLYNAKIDISGREYDAFITKDGQLLFPSGYDMEAAAPSRPSQPAQAAKVEAGVDDDPMKGDKNAPVTIIEFSDFQCPFCARFYQQTLPQIQKEYIDTGKVRFVYRDLPLESIHPQARPAAEAAACADEQGKFWAYHDKIFENQAQLSTANLKQWAADLGLDTAKFNDCVDSNKYAEEVTKDMQDARAARGSGTPYFVINGIPLSGAQPFSAFQAAIEQALEE